MEYKNVHITSQPDGWVLTATLPSGNIVEVKRKTFKQVVQFVKDNDITLTIGDIIYEARKNKPSRRRRGNDGLSGPSGIESHREGNWTLLQTRKSTSD